MLKNKNYLDSVKQLEIDNENIEIKLFVCLKAFISRPKCLAYF